MFRGISLRQPVVPYGKLTSLEESMTENNVWIQDPDSQNLSRKMKTLAIIDRLNGAMEENKFHWKRLKLI